MKQLFPIIILLCLLFIMFIKVNHKNSQIDDLYKTIGKYDQEIENKEREIRVVRNDIEKKNLKILELTDIYKKELSTIKDLLQKKFTKHEKDSILSNLSRLP